MATSRRRNLLTKLGEKMMEIDKYGESASFNIAGKSSYPSVYGTLISILVLVIVIPYATNKFVVMQNYEDTNFSSITLENGTSMKEEIGYETHDLNVMLSFMSFANGSYSLEDLEAYITVDAWIWQNPEFVRWPISLVKCTKRDFDLSLFSHGRIPSVDIEKAFCIANPEEVKLKGNLSSDKWKSLMIQINRCSGQDAVCKSEEEID